MNLVLHNSKIAIIATHGVDAKELSIVRKAIQEKGVHTALIGLTDNPIKTWSDKQWREEVAVDLAIDKAHVDDYDALFLPGGLLNSDKLRTSSQVVSFIAEMYKTKKMIAAICHAPWLLIDAGIIKNKKVTSYPSLKNDLQNAGAIWVDEQVVVDGNIITSRRPEDAEEFSKKITSFLL